MNKLLELAKKRTAIKFESKKDKKEFLKWYKKNGGSLNCAREKYNKNSLFDIVEIWYYDEEDEIVWNVHEESNYTWKQLKKEHLKKKKPVKVVINEIPVTSTTHKYICPICKTECQQFINERVVIFKCLNCDGLLERS